LFVDVVEKFFHLRTAQYNLVTIWSARFDDVPNATETPFPSSRAVIPSLPERDAPVVDATDWITVEV
jgi:hypothetical protein